jgi:hypothetical protein
MPYDPADLTDREATTAWVHSHPNAHDRQRAQWLGANEMRSLLILGLLMTVFASANAATMHHHRTLHHVIRPGEAAAVPSFAFAPPPPLIDSAVGLALTN